MSGQFISPVAYSSDRAPDPYWIQRSVTDVTLV